MSRKRHRGEPRERRSPTDTVANATDDWMEELNIPGLPGHIPQRLEEAMRARIEALMFQLREAKPGGYVRSLEIRLVRDAHRAVLTAVELGVADARVYYSQFRELVAELGYERCDVGFRRAEES